MSQADLNCMNTYLTEMKDLILGKFDIFLKPPHAFKAVKL